MDQCMIFPTMCDQQSLRSSCAYAQSDQSLCGSLEYSMSAQLLTEHHLEFLSFKGGYRGSSESHTCQNATLLEITCHGSCWTGWRSVWSWLSHVVQVLKVRLGQQPSFPVMEDGAPCARALQMAKGLARGVTFKAVYFKSCSISLKR